jgi:hypothetical protein
VLKNPLINLNEEIQRLEELLKSKKFTSKKQSKHYELLSGTLHAFREVRENELDFYYSGLKELKLDFDEHLSSNPNSEIIGESISIDFYLCCSAGYFGVDGAIAAVIQSFCN